MQQLIYNKQQKCFESTKLSASARREWKRNNNTQTSKTQRELLVQQIIANKHPFNDTVDVVFRPLN